MRMHQAVAATIGPFNADFWKFWLALSISNLGSAFTTFALPLLIFQQTGSALNLALGTGVTFLPYLLFGLVIGAWVDRTNRRRLMILADLIRALLLLILPLMIVFGAFSIWALYLVMFLSSTLTIGFSAAQHAAVPNLVDRSRLIVANGRVQMSISASLVLGPLLASLVVSIAPAHILLLIDALSFLCSALMLASIRTSFDASEKHAPGSFRRDIGEGLSYVFKHPVLFNISLMLVLVIFVVSTAQTQLILFAKQHLQATDTQAGLLYTAGGIGFLISSVAAGFVRRFFSFSAVILGATMLKGLCIAGMGLTKTYWLALILWGFGEGMNMLFNLNTLSLRQTIVPGHLLGRVISIAQVLAWSSVPVGTFVGGLIIERTRDVAMVYTAIGVSMCLITCAFVFTPLRHIERYLPQEELTQHPQQIPT